MPLLLLLSERAILAADPAFPKAARTVNLVYEIGQADVFYNEMVIDKVSDGSFYMAVGWNNGYFGLQQYDGEDKRALIFAIWNATDTNAEEGKKAPPVKVRYASENGKTNKFALDGRGAQFMRQVNWKLGETNRFLVDAAIAGTNATYTAWFQNQPSGQWEKLATFQAYSNGKWMRGYHSFIEDFRRDGKSPNETRGARFMNTWAHEFEGTWNFVDLAMFAATSMKTEAKETINAGIFDLGFNLETGGAVLKKEKPGARLSLPKSSLPRPEMPRLPFLDYNKPMP